VIYSLEGNRHEAEGDDVGGVEVHHCLHVFKPSVEYSEDQKGEYTRYLPVYFAMNTPFQEASWGFGIDRPE
jgi:hypothetical protein